MLRSLSGRPLVALAIAAFSLAVVGRASAEEPIDFNKEVRPILSEYCFKCHGIDDKSRKGKLRLDVRDAALQPASSDERAIVPGKPDESELVRRILTDDEDEVMPPPSMKKRKTATKRPRAWCASACSAAT